MKKYDETATAMIGELKYGAGLPFNRIQKLQAGMGIPLPADDSMELVRDGAGQLTPAYQELVRQAAQGKVLYNDDTTMKVLELTRTQRAAAAADEETDERTGVFTSGIVSTARGCPSHCFLLAFSMLGRTWRMYWPSERLACPSRFRCVTRSRRIPLEISRPLWRVATHTQDGAMLRWHKTSGGVSIRIGNIAKGLQKRRGHHKKEMSATERLAFHKEHSGPLMEGLAKWMAQQFAERKVEPNSVWVKQSVTCRNIGPG